ncbi:MAG: peptidylprolyl isomerase [Acidobacteriota bacterium]
MTLQPGPSAVASLRLRRCVLWLSLLGLVGVVAITGHAAAEDEAPALAHFRAAVTARELASWRQHGMPEGGAAVREEEAVRQLLLVRSLAQEAERLGLDREPAHRIDLARAEGQIALQALRRHVDEAIRIGDAEVAAKVEEIQGTRGLPRRVRLRNLFKRFPQNASAAEKAALRRRMDELRRQVLAGADFAALAEAESDSRTRLRGGLIGNVRAGDLRPEVDRIAMALEAGEVSAVLSGPEGLTLLYCESVLEAVERSADDLRQIARRSLRQQASRRDWAAMEEHLLAAAAPRWRWGRLDGSGENSGDEAEPEAVLVEFLGGRLTVAEVLVLALPEETASPAAVDRLRTLDRDQIERRVEPFLRQRLAIREVAVRGLGSAAMAEQVRWSRARLLAAKALAKHVGERRGAVEERDVEAFFEAHPERFERPAHYRLGLLELPFEAVDPRPALDLGLGLLAALEAGEVTFAELVREHSAHLGDGDLGWLPRSAVIRRLGIDGLRALERLQPGQRSQWVQDDQRSRFLLIELRGFEAPRPATFAEARARARRLLVEEKAAAQRAAFIAEWWQGLAVEFRATPRE